MQGDWNERECMAFIFWVVGVRGCGEGSGGGERFGCEGGTQEGQVETRRKNETRRKSENAYTLYDLTVARSTRMYTEDVLKRQEPRC